MQAGAADIILAMQDVSTIAAISTPLGAGAIGIVRMTGPRAVSICQEVCHLASGDPLSEMRSHGLGYGAIQDPASGELVDEVLVGVMRAPGSYTREDIVEVNCHGGPVVQQKILSLFLERGARLATPGEFTKRAFLNGRIDLSQAESVAQIISAKTEAGLRVAMAQLDGSISREIGELRQSILRVTAAVEADIDFSDEDIEELDREQAEGLLAEIQERLGELIDSAFVGRVLSQGVRTAIVGKPNVGKSSLLNALLMRERAIVTEIPGTTRDTIEEIINVQGIPLQLIDTAGLRPAEDEVEQIGVDRSRRAIREADLVLCLFDGSEPEDDHDRALITSVPRENAVYVINKCDRFRGQTPRFNQGLLPGEPVIISAMTRQGLKTLKGKIAELVVGGALPPLEGPIVTHERHRLLLEQARDALGRAQQGLRVGIGEELIAEELRASLIALGEITGEEMLEGLLDTIFREFCIGK
ncbi:MAG: tRNA uridine-5-carboxymethylaminomethyl(34) synthesis GTPase MnmE [Actinobacteria bacterium]|nr:tRNA uridine-5-carboxymethylaminomethyl(34) synthesis GTPase MnmE [Actinomycetota bacterium]